MAFVEGDSAGDEPLVDEQVAQGIARFFLVVDDAGGTVDYLAAGSYHLVHGALPHKIHGAAQDALAVVSQVAADVFEHGDVEIPRRHKFLYELCGLFFYYIIGVEPHDIIARGEGKTIVAGGGKIVAPLKIVHLCAEVCGNLFAAVRRARVHHYHLVGDGKGAVYAAGDDVLLVLNYHTNRKSHIISL